jgi:hypothetical protein
MIKTCLFICLFLVHSQLVLSKSENFRGYNIPHRQSNHITVLSNKKNIPNKQPSLPSEPDLTEVARESYRPPQIYTNPANERPPVVEQSPKIYGKLPQAQPIETPKESYRPPASYQATSPQIEIELERPIENKPKPSTNYGQSTYNQAPKPYEQPPKSYEQPPQSYEQPPQSYEQPKSYEQPPKQYEQPPTSYEQPPQSYQQPPQSYEQPPKSYQQPPKSYEQPSTKYEQPPQSYEQPPKSYVQPAPPAPYAQPPVNPPPPSSYGQNAQYLPQSIHYSSLTPEQIRMINEAKAQFETLTNTRSQPKYSYLQQPQAYVAAATNIQAPVYKSRLQAIYAR